MYPPKIKAHKYNFEVKQQAIISYAQKQTRELTRLIKPTSYFLNYDNSILSILTNHLNREGMLNATIIHTFV